MRKFYTKFATQSLMIFSNEKFWKVFPNMSVKAIETSSLIKGLVAANPGSQAPLMILSKTRSKSSRPYNRFDMCNLRSRIF